MGQLHFLFHRKFLSMKQNAWQDRTGTGREDVAEATRRRRRSLRADFFLFDRKFLSNRMVLCAGTQWHHDANVTRSRGRGCCKIRIPVEFRHLFRRKRVSFRRKIIRKSTAGDLLQNSFFGGKMECICRLTWNSYGLLEERRVYMTKIDIISGFLGAGKTTLIKKLIKEAFAGQQIVLIENEFGEIGIDGGFLKDAGVNITEMNSGCICCSLVGDFGKALQEVMERFAPSRIVIEPSGVGKLSDVRRAVENVEKDCDIKVNSLVTVADVSKVKMYMKNFGEFYNNQIESAGTIILSRTQKVSQEKLDAALSLIREKNPEAVIITTPWDQLSGEQILGAMEKSVSLADELLHQMEEEETCPVCGHHHEHHHDHDCGCGEHDHEHHHDHDCGCGEHHHHHHADEVFTSWGRETAKQFTKEQMEEILHKLSEGEEYGVILRAKGMVPNGEGGWIYFDLVPGEYELREGQPDYTGRLCVIGSKLQEKKLEQLFGLA